MGILESLNQDHKLKEWDKELSKREIRAQELFGYEPSIALTDEQAALTIPHLIERTETLAKALNTGEFEQAGLEAEVSRDDTMRIPFEDVQEIESVPIVHVYEKSDGYVGTGLSSDDDAISDDEVHLELEEMMEDAEDHDGGRFLQIRRHESPAIDSAFGETLGSILKVLNEVVRSQGLKDRIVVDEGSSDDYKRLVARAERDLGV